VYSSYPFSTIHPKYKTNYYSKFRRAGKNSGTIAAFDSVLCHHCPSASRLSLRRAPAYRIGRIAQHYRLPNEARNIVKEGGIELLFVHSSAYQGR
jgi:hypothetical protein